MSRSWRSERITPKNKPLKAPQRPRMDEFAKEYYQGKGYQVETLQDDPDAYGPRGHEEVDTVTFIGADHEQA